jgi:ATP-binding cassette, subfamily C, bacterial exporter for protease/lipase
MKIWSMKPAGGELGEALLAFRRAFYSVAGFSFAINVLLLVPAIYMLQIYDRVLASRNELTLYMLTLMMLGLYVLEAALELVRGRVLARVGTALDLHVGERVFDAAFERYLRGRGGNPGQSLADLASVRQFVTGKGLFAFFDTPWTPIYIIVIYFLHPTLGIFALCSVAVLLAMAYFNERATAPLLRTASAFAASANQFAATNLKNAEVIEAMGMLPSLRRRWFERQKRFMALQAYANDKGAWISSITRFLRLAMQSLVLGIGALLVIDGSMTPGGMIAAAILLGRALSPIDLLIATWRTFVSAREGYDRLEQLLAEHPRQRESLVLPRPEGFVSAENLVVCAPGSRQPILNGLNFRVSPGMMIAVIGPSAAGKSTLARALVGIWQPLAGSMRLDGADVYRWSKEQLGPWVGYLPQDVELFEGTIAENIARFADVDAERVVHAAKRAGIHDMVLHLPDGYETSLGEGGIALSGGQRQRVALARALYGDPALIVLDEPNASLDDAGDAALLTALRAMKEEKRTLFIITHRANILNLADAVMLLANGAIQAFGPRDLVTKALRPQATPGIEAKKRGSASGEEEAAA